MVDRIVGNVEGDVGHDPACGIAQPFLQPPEQIASELIVFPEHGDLPVGIADLDIVCEHAPLGAKRRLPAHGPRKRSWMRPFLVAGGDEQLRDFSLVEILAGREIVRRAKRAEHQEHLLLLNQFARPRHSFPGVGAVIDGHELDLAPVDAAALVDHLEKRGFRLSDSGKCRHRTGIGHDVADADFGLISGILLRHRGSRRQ